MGLFMSYVKKGADFLEYCILYLYSETISILDFIFLNKSFISIFSTSIKYSSLAEIVGILIFIFFPEKRIKRSRFLEYITTINLIFFETLLFPLEYIYLNLKDKNLLFIKTTVFFMAFLIFVRCTNRSFNDILLLFFILANYYLLVIGMYVLLLH